MNNEEGNTLRTPLGEPAASPLEPGNVQSLDRLTLRGLRIVADNEVMARDLMTALLAAAGRNPAMIDGQPGVWPKLIRIVKEGRID